MFRKNSNKWLVGFLVACSTFVFAPTVIGASPGPAKNVIVLMTDGTGTTHTTITRWYKGGLLPQDPFIVGGVRTYGADSIITDSAPAASAFATGHKTDDKFISVLPPKTTIPGLAQVAEDLKYKPVASVLEGAKFVGKSTGLIATSNIQHASPAAYSAHWPDRSNYDEIAEQQVYQNMDVVLSGGKQYLLTKDLGGTRTDGENLINVLKAKGYGFVENKQDMLDYKGKKLWGLFANDALDYDMDRQLLRPDQPSLADMTKKAIDILSKNPKGFFLFVEASKVDWASHANEPIGVISDSLAYADAIQVALDFAKKDGNTLVLCFTDHSNGGMSIGSNKTDKTYSSTPFAQLIDPLKKATLTAEGIEVVLGSNRESSNIRQIVSQYYGVEDLTEEEVRAIEKAKKGALPNVLGPIISKRSIVSWTTTGHTGEDVFLYAYGPGKPAGLIENTQLAYICSTGMGFDLDQIDYKLFIEASAAFKPLGAIVTIDKTDPVNPVLVIENGTKQAKLPFSKNLVIVNGKTHEMTGITVYAPKTDKVYVPRQAVELVRNAWK
ncbi:alkaline phosphatase [Sporomusa malonica]|uniref:Alkaline phosphatase n=1 Tax=Sporomusa malonica TaxID=112901 RepID=A0A1W2CXS3_9FIRM|nr:alkaline phosphatase [Sporomusa malonica]SMC90023.1 alkaline phosphatase [Sporomusa malonica]